MGRGVLTGCYFANHSIKCKINNIVSQVDPGVASALHVNVIMFKCHPKTIKTYYQQVREMDPWKRVYP